MNIVIKDRMIELSEHKTKFQKIRLFASNWKNVVFLSLFSMTMKVAIEQIIMLIVRGGK